MRLDYVRVAGTGTHKGLAQLQTCAVDVCVTHQRPYMPVSLTHHGIVIDIVYCPQHCSVLTKASVTTYTKSSFFKGTLSFTDGKWGLQGVHALDETVVVVFVCGVRR